MLRRCGVSLARGTGATTKFRRMSLLEVDEILHSTDVPPASFLRERLANRLLLRVKVCKNTAMRLLMEEWKQLPPKRKAEYRRNPIDGITFK